MNRPPRILPASSFTFGREAAALRAHNLKTCDKCNNETDPLGGVEIRSKWHCAKCWVKFTRGSLR